jgi:hypothetical protein
MSPALPPNRAAFREAVHAIAQKATAKLPECNGRVDLAVKLVLAGDVELVADGTTRVYSASNGVSSYEIANGVCTCVDFPRAPHGFCKHRLAAAIYRRALELCPGEPGAAQMPQEGTEASVGTCDTCPPADAPPGLPEAPASANVRVTIAGREVQITLRDTDETKLLARLQTLLEQFPVEKASSQPQERGKDWCSIHNVSMKQTTKDGRSWFSHRVDGRWCKGR